MCLLKTLGHSLAARVPVLTYGAAHTHARKLQDLRRALGYFGNSNTGVFGFATWHV